MSSEREDAIKLANKVLDMPHLDPDGDLCLLARQLLRLRDGAISALQDQIKYCSNGCTHTAAKNFLSQWELKEPK